LQYDTSVGARDHEEMQLNVHEWSSAGKTGLKNANLSHELYESIGGCRNTSRRTIAAVADIGRSALIITQYLVG
jgi:hypothetical protein